MRLRLIADDLTGALDSAAPFATPDTPVRLVLNLKDARWPEMTAFSTESRNLTRTEAIARVQHAFSALNAAQDLPASEPILWFKKIDSVLRGHPIAETMALARAGGFRRCIFTPAFPQMGRITRDGRAWLRDLDGGLEPIGPDDLHRALSDDGYPELDLVVLNAETQQGLRVGVGDYLGAPATLWAGSGGLARAIATPHAPLAPPHVGLFILGTNHPATRAQARVLTNVTTKAPQSGPIIPSRTMPLLLDPVPESPDAARTRDALLRGLQRLAPPTDESALFVTGGDCLALVLQATGATGLDCTGEVGAGLPVSRIIGGSLDRAQVISKSGGFGGPDALLGLVAG